MGRHRRPRCDQAPYLKPPPDVMTVEEIRYWLTMLMVKYGWGPVPIERTLGMGAGRWPGYTVKGKASGVNWIYRSEQIRWSKVLKRIIAGEIAYEPARKWRVVVVDFPRPLPQPQRHAFDMLRGGC